jgi:hypothetical protein
VKVEGKTFSSFRMCGGHEGLPSALYLLPFYSGNLLVFCFVNQLYGFVVGTVDRGFCEGARWMDCAFEVVVAGKKLAVGAGNLVHFPRSLRRISNRGPQTPGRHKN